MSLHAGKLIFELVGLGRQAILHLSPRGILTVEQQLFLLQLRLQLGHTLPRLSVEFFELPASGDEQTLLLRQLVLQFVHLRIQARLKFSCCRLLPAEDPLLLLKLGLQVGHSIARLRIKLLKLMQHRFLLAENIVFFLKLCLQGGDFFPCCLVQIPELPICGFQHPIFSRKLILQRSDLRR